MKLLEILQGLLSGTCGAALGGIVAKTLLCHGFCVIAPATVAARGLAAITIGALPIVAGVIGGLVIGLVAYGVYTYFFSPSPDDKNVVVPPSSKDVHAVVPYWQVSGWQVSNPHYKSWQDIDEEEMKSIVSKMSLPDRTNAIVFLGKFLDVLKSSVLLI